MEQPGLFWTERMRQKVTFNMSMSLDGFVAGPNGEVDNLFGWYSSGDTEFPFPCSSFVFKVSPNSAQVLREAGHAIGAVITGKRNFSGANAWGGSPPLGVHHYVLTHHPEPEWERPGSPFTFVTDGIESAVSQAKRHAGERDVCISTASVMRQALAAGLLDEVNIDLVPVVLGSGVRLFEGDELTHLEIARVVEGHGVTHLRYRVVR